MSIAGGIVLFLISLRMIFPTEKGIMGEMPAGEPFFVPLAVPLLAGPSTFGDAYFTCQISTGPNL